MTRKPTQPPIRKRASPPSTPTVPLPSPSLPSPSLPPLRSNRHQGSVMGSAYANRMDPGMMGVGGYPIEAQSNMGSMAHPQAQARAQMAGMGPGGELKAFDAGKLKAGRLGHYGYLEGRELAGPPPGHLPAGVKPDQLQQSSVGGGGSVQSQSLGKGTHRAPSQHGTQYAPSQYQHPHSPTQYHHQQQQHHLYAQHGQQGRSPPISPGSMAGSQALSLSQSGWGNQNDVPRARYDGTSNATRYIRADLDTPYPRLGAGGMSSSATRYDGRQEAVNGNGYRDAFGYAEGGGQIDGRLGKGHRRMREGKV